MKKFFCLKRALLAQSFVVKTAVFAVLLFCTAPSAPALGETIRLGGTGGALGAMRLLAEEFRKIHPDVTIIVAPSMGSSGGIKALLSGALDIGLSSRPLAPAEQDQGAEEEEYARTPFVFAASAKNRVSGLTLEQIVAIFSGKVKTWPDGAPIRLILRPASEFDTMLLTNISEEMDRAVKDARSRKGMIVAVTDQDSADAIEKVPGALGTTTLAQIVAEKRSLKKLSLNGVDPSPKTIADGTYPYFKTFYLVTMRNPSRLVRQFIDFLRSPRGREILTRTGHQVTVPS